MRKMVLCLIIVLIAVISCDYYYDYSYIVKNKSQYMIKIELKTYNLDSAYYIMPNETKRLYVTKHGAEGAQGPHFNDVTEDLKMFTVTCCDTIKSKKNYLSNSNWSFEDGNYKAIITNKEFKE